MVGLKKINHQY